nr:calcipressin-3 [Manis javanica]XP_036873824.1 calcipressin-3 [Manis javanica]XP_036873825.1 calcipressin-3 [Manis javanica]XP_036873826.1 calcipressin-3 [Manis javanica]
MLKDTMKSWNDSQSDLCSSDQEEEEMIFGENEDDLEEMMDLSDLPTSLFACSVHEAVFEVQEQKVGVRPAVTCVNVCGFKERDCCPFAKFVTGP